MQTKPKRVEAKKSNNTGNKLRNVQTLTQMEGQVNQEVTPQNKARNFKPVQQQNDLNLHFF